ncbi:MAG: protein-L-isoaspartate(D-aspartate) O-methyltransferase [Desulfobacterales bacterium]|nr:protein-L-isoaspartate(D-aspartate) O-methyltransferase [Desulfobacterales bacterium]
MERRHADNALSPSCSSWLLPCAVAAGRGAAEPAAMREARERMVREQIQARGISRPEVLEAHARRCRGIGLSPRTSPTSAYQDHPLPIGEGQTISQPYIVALMTELLDLKPTEQVLEIGTGSGYQAAVLSALASDVYTIEIKQKLFENASNNLKKYGYKNVTCRHGDGYFGWPEAAPFDAIMITAAVDHIPPPLIAQLKDGGRLVLPLGSPFGYQNLVLVTKRGREVVLRNIIGVLFVPLTGHAMDKR